jgi:ABC-type branched-subunit amino acid transport system substrate-binding protein
MRLSSLLATLLLVLAFVCSSPAFAQNPRAEARGNGLTLGVALPLSGQFGPVGRQILQAAQLAAQEQGITLDARDTEGDPKKAMEVIEALAAEKSIVGIIGPLGRRESEAAAVVAERRGVPLFTLSSVETITRLGRWVFRVRATPAEQAEFMAEKAYKSFGLRRAAILFPATDYGREASLAFAKRFVELGGLVVGVADYDEETTDFTPPLSVVVGKLAQVGRRVRIGKRRSNRKGYIRVGKEKVDFDTLFVPDFHQRVARILAFLPLVGIQNGDGGDGTAVQLLGLSGWQGKSMELTGGKAAGAIYVDVYGGQSTDARSDEFERVFEQMTGRAPVDVEAETFDAVWLLASLAKDIKPAELPPGTNARWALFSALPRRKPWRGVCGELSFELDGGVKRGFGLYRFDVDGVVTPVEQR